MKLSAIAAEKESPPNGRTGTVSSTIAVLRLLASGQPMGVNAIARQLCLAPSSCFKILKSLQLEDVIDFDENTKAYSLGSGAIGIAKAALDPSRAYSLVRSRLEQAAQEMAMAMGFWRITPDERIVLTGFAEGSMQMRIHMSVGQRLPMLIGAVGRAIAANMDLPRNELKRRFGQLRWYNAPSFDEYAEKVNEAKKTGYALDLSWFSPGVNTVAIAITDEIGVARYGISGIMFSGQSTGREMEEIGEKLKPVVRWVELRLFGWPEKS